MTVRPDLERAVTDWLYDEAVTSGSDRVLAATLVRVAGSSQDRTPRLLRFFDMNSTARLLIAAAAVVVVAVVGIALLGSRTESVGGPTVSPSPSPVPSAAASPSLAAAFPAEGPLPVGTHALTYDGIPMSLSIPTSGWSSLNGNEITKGEYGQPDWVGIDFWLNAPDNVYADPCAHKAQDPEPDGTAAGLAAAAAAVPVTEVVSGPTSIEVGGHPAQHVVLKIKDDLACDPHDAYLWYDDSLGQTTKNWRWAEGLGATYRVWITEVDGKLVWIDAYTFPGAAPELGRDIQKVIDSIRFD